MYSFDKNNVQLISFLLILKIGTYYTDKWYLNLSKDKKEINCTLFFYHNYTLRAVFAKYISMA